MCDVVLGGGWCGLSPITIPHVPGLTQAVGRIIKISDIPRGQGVPVAFWLKHLALLPPVPCKVIALYG